MAQSLGNLVLTLQADSKDLERELQRIQKLSEQTGAKITSKIKASIGKDLTAELQKIQQLALATNTKISGKKVGDDLILSIRQNTSRAQSEGKNLGSRIAEGILQGIGQSLARGVSGVITGALGTLKSAVQSSLGFITDSNQIYNQFQSYRNILNLVAGDVKKGGEAFKFATETAKQLRAPLEDSVRGFAKLSAASRGTALEGEGTKNIFLALTMAARTYNLDQQQLNRVIEASGQVISKGRVQWEELRGQIGDALPGAVQIAQRAFGLTGKAFEDLMRQGISAEEFFTRFSYQLASETASGVAGGLKLTTAAAANASNQFIELRRKLGEAVDPAIKGAYEFLGNVLQRIIEKVGGFDALQQQAQKFANWLNGATGPSKIIADKISELATKGINKAAEFAERFTQELEKNPGKIQEMVDGFGGFIKDLKVAVELVADIARLIGNAAGALKDFGNSDFSKGVANLPIPKIGQAIGRKLLGRGEDSGSTQQGAALPARSSQATPELVTALRRAIIGQESNGNFRAVNRHTGALGYGQVMEFNLPSWTKSALGRSIGRNEFLNNPKAQIQTIDHKLKEYLDTALKKSGGDTSTAIRMAAAGWYAGPGNMKLYNNQKPQYSGGARYPSIAHYTNSVLSRTQGMFGDLGQQVGFTGRAAAGQASGGGGAVFPVAGMNYRNARYTSEFGMRRHPVHGTHKMHRGLDVGAPTGTPVLAPMAGVVKRTFFDKNGGGNVVVVESYDDKGRTLTHKFLHLSSFAVKAGDMVRPGQKVGGVGNTGTGTGAHLHYGTQLDGKYINPREVLSGRLGFNARSLPGAAASNNINYSQLGFGQPGSPTAGSAGDGLSGDITSRLASMKSAADAAAVRAAADRARVAREDALKQKMEENRRFLSGQHETELARFDVGFAGMGESDRAAAGFMRQRIQRRQELETNVQGFAQAQEALNIERAKKIREGGLGGKDYTAEIQSYNVQIQNARNLYQLQLQALDIEAKRAGVKVNLEQAEARITSENRQQVQKLQDAQRLEQLNLQAREGQTNAAKALFAFDEQAQRARQTRDRERQDILQKIQELQLKEQQERSGFTRTGVDYSAQIGFERQRLTVVEQSYNKELDLINRNRKEKEKELVEGGLTGTRSALQSANDFRISTSKISDEDRRILELKAEYDRVTEDLKKQIDELTNINKAIGGDSQIDIRIASLKDALSNAKENYLGGKSKIQEEEAKKIAQLIKGELESVDSIIEKASSFRRDNTQNPLAPDAQLQAGLSDLEDSYEDVANSIQKQLEALTELEGKVGENIQIDEQRNRLNWELSQSTDAYREAQVRLKDEEARRVEQANFEFKAQQSQVRGQVTQSVAARLRGNGRGVAANDLERGAATEAEQYRYQGEVRQLEELHRTGQLTNEQLAEAKTNAEALNQVNLEGIQGQFNLLSQALEPLKSNFQQFFQDLFSGSKSLGDSLKDLFKGILSNLLNMATQTLTNQLFSGITGGGQSGGGGGFLGKLLGGLFGGGGGGGGGLLGGLFGGGSGGGGLGLLGHILPFANGGVVTRPTLGLIGEAGPEAVIPLNRVPSIGGGGGGMSVSIPISINAGAGGDYEQLKRELRAEIEPVAVRVIQRQKRPGGILSN